MKNQSFFFGFTIKFWISALFLFLLLWWFIHKVGTIIMLPFGFSLVIAYIFHTIVEKIHKKFNVPLGIISISIVTLLFSSLTLFCIFFIPIAIKNIYTIVQNIPAFAETLHSAIVQYIPIQIDKIIVESYSNLDKYLPSILEAILKYFGNLSTFFTQLFTFFIITPIASYYMIKDWNTINANILMLIPHKHRSIFVEIRTEIRKKLAGYIVGQFYIILFFSTFYAVGLSIMNLKFGFTIGILTGIATIIPYVGFAFGFAIGLMMAFLQNPDPIYIMIIIGIFTAGQVIESSFLTPVLMSNKIQIHPLWVVFGFLFFGVIFGFFGIFFALPLTAIFSVLIKFYVKNYYKKRCI